MLVALAGRQGSGKTTLANDLRRGGFKRLSFAGRLKSLVAAVYGWDEESLYTEDGKQGKLDKPVKWGLFEAEHLGALVKATRPLRSEKREFATRREALQYVGTDVLRAYDDQFHLNSVREQVAAEPNADFVLDDCRFLNELQVMRELDAIPVFVMRPDRYQYSNHKSESELRRRHFRYVVLNDRSQADFVRGFHKLYGYAMDERFGAGEPSDETFLVASRDGWTTCDHDCFSEAGPETAYWCGYMMAAGEVLLDRPAGVRLSVPESKASDLTGFCTTVGASTGAIRGGKSFTCEIRSPLLADDLKLWGVGATRRDHAVPFMLGSDGEIMSLWVAGLSDASAMAANGKLRITCSKAVVEAVKGWAGCGGEVTPADPSGDTLTLQYADEEVTELADRLRRVARSASAIRRGTFQR